MIKVWRKIWNISRNVIRTGIHEYRMKERARKTIHLRSTQSSDYERWEKSEELFLDWNERSSLMAELIKPNSRIIEFGAGNMAMKSFLPPGCTYTPSDIHKRSSSVIICDLNQKIEMDLSRYDTALFCGVLEYVYDIDRVLLQLKSFIPNLILSYSCRDVSIVDRIRRGWLSDYSSEELESIFRKHNYYIMQRRMWRDQMIYSLKQNFEE